MMDVSETSRSLVLPVQRVGVDEPWEWLSAGWRDFRRAPSVSLTYGAAFVAVSFLLTLGLWLADLFYLVLPLAAGFMFIGPVVAVGLYEVSRRPAETFWTSDSEMENSPSEFSKQRENLVGILRIR